MSVAGSDITVDQEEGGIPEITMRFRRLIGGMRLLSFKGNPTELQEWIQSIQKKQVIYGLSDQEMVLLAYEAAAGPVSKYVGGLNKENPTLTWTKLKSALVQQYASELTAVEAVKKLFRLRQGDSEAMRDLGERIAVLAFPELATWNSGPIQALLADVYMDACNSEQLWDRIRGSMARDPRGTNIMKKKDQVQVWDLKEEVEECWESEADWNRREWDLQYGFYRPTPAHTGLVCQTRKYGGHRSQSCPTKWGGNPRSRRPNCKIDGKIRAQSSVVHDGRRP